NMGKAVTSSSQGHLQFLAVKRRFEHIRAGLHHRHPLCISGLQVRIFVNVHQGQVVRDLALQAFQFAAGVFTQRAVGLGVERNRDHGWSSIWRKKLSMSAALIWPMWKKRTTP